MFWKYAKRSQYYGGVWIKYILQNSKGNPKDKTDNFGKSGKHEKGCKGENYYHQRRRFI